MLPFAEAETVAGFGQQRRLLNSSAAAPPVRSALCGFAVQLRARAAFCIVTRRIAQVP